MNYKEDVVLQEIAKEVVKMSKSDDKSLSLVDKMKPTQMLYNYCNMMGYNVNDVQEDLCDIKVVGEYDPEISQLPPNYKKTE